MAEEKVVLEIRVPRGNEYTPEAAASLFTTIVKTLPAPKLFSRKRPSIALEIACFGQTIHFFAVLPQSLVSYFESQILGTYPLAVMSRTPDYLAQWQEEIAASNLVLSSSYYYPLKTYKDFEDVDPLSTVLAVMSKASPEDRYLFQLVLTPAGTGWQRKAASMLARGIKQPDETVAPHPDAKVIEEKIDEVGLKVAMRMAANSWANLSALAGAFATFARGDGNALVTKAPQFWQKEKFRKALYNREFAYAPRLQVLTVSELASLWHLPGEMAKVPNIAWGRQVLSEPPENLPAAVELTDELKEKINFFAKTEYKNKLVTFGIKKDDRRLHFYMVGKTGTGKSTTIANMAINDMRNREGVAVVDPHGDLSNILLDYIPSYRINDVVYLDPSDREFPFALNPLEAQNRAQRELVASGIVSIFYKLYAHSWGPRLEHILRSTLLSLVEIPNTTLADVPKTLTDQGYRRRMVDRLEDPVLRQFWLAEYEKMSPSLQSEAISPILNKVGQFVTSPLIRRVIGRPHSTVNLEKLMNDGKILILNLSQGKMGEDNAALLGAMVITKIQLAAMNRVNIPEPERRDFYLYVDEFQNFATTSFIKILSEARKYRLNLSLANQYMAQLSEEVQAAILGNAGTLVSFAVGSADAQILSREFSEVFSENDLVGLSNFQVVTKLSIDNLTSRPFFAYTLPLPKSRNQNREKVIRVSRERYAYEKKA